MKDKIIIAVFAAWGLTTVATILWFMFTGTYLLPFPSQSPIEEVRLFAGVFHAVFHIVGFIALMALVCCGDCSNDNDYGW
jgi:hypothetical protein